MAAATSGNDPKPLGECSSTSPALGPNVNTRTGALWLVRTDLFRILIAREGEHKIIFGNQEGEKHKHESKISGSYSDQNLQCSAS